jgi:hypothetical protein
MASTAYPRRAQTVGPAEAGLAIRLAIPTHFLTKKTAVTSTYHSAFILPLQLFASRNRLPSRPTARQR